MFLEALQHAAGDLFVGFELAILGAVLASVLVWLEARKERRATIRLQRREWPIASTKPYEVIGGGRRGPGV